MLTPPPALVLLKAPGPGLGPGLSDYDVFLSSVPSLTVHKDGRLKVLPVLPHLTQPCFLDFSSCAAQKQTGFAWLEWRVVAWRPTSQWGIYPFACYLLGEPAQKLLVCL